MERTYNSKAFYVKHISMQKMFAYIFEQFENKFSQLRLNAISFYTF